MRTAFIETLCQVAAEDERVWLLTGDLGFSVLEGFSSRFPDRYVNVGVAEQNMTGVAAGLALSGKIVFTYSIANFPTFRCLEQIRNDVCYHKANVKVVAVGGGFAYGTQGYTHHGVEDIAVMRALPGMTVVAPGDPLETRLATRAVTARPGACYLRLGKANEPLVHSSEPDFQLGKAIPLREGSDVTMISTGGMLSVAVAAADRLAARHDLSIGVLSMPTVKPIDADAIRRVATTSRAVVTAEEHSITGGLGSAVAEVLAEWEGPRVLFRRYGTPDRVYHDIGAQDHLRLKLAGDLDTLILDLLNSGSGNRNP